MTTDDTPIETSEAEARPWKPSDGYTESPAASASTTHAMVCHAPGERCLGCARYRGESPVCEHASQQGEASNLWAQGHGHVVPRSDGVKARCGGPALCKVCQAEQAALAKAQQGEAVAWSHEWDTDGYVVREFTANPRHCGLVTPDRSRPLVYGDAQPAAAPQPVAQDVLDAVEHGEFELGQWTTSAIHAVERNPSGALRIIRRLQRQLAAAPAGVVGEPVALDHLACIEDGQLRYMTGRKAPGYDCELYAMPGGGNAPALYTAPPARQALTDEQIDKLIPSSVFGGYTLADGKTHIDEVWTRNQVRAAVRACAESWGVTLVGIGGKGETDHG